MADYDPTTTNELGYANEQITNPLETTIEQQVTEPTLAPEATYTAQTTEDVVGEQAIQEGMIEEGTGAITGTKVTAPTTTPEATTVEAPEMAPAETYTAATTAGQVGTIEGATREEINARAQVVAEQGELSDAAMATAVERQLTAKETVAGQLDALFANTAPGEVPLWAKPAVAQVEAMLAERGVGKSSVAKEQLYNAIISSAMPIAQADAQAQREVFLTNLSNKNKEVFFNAANVANMDMTNLNNRQVAAVENAKAFLQLDFQNMSNEQQAAVISYQAKQQALMSDASAKNAARQFNASSENQVNQFFANLAATIDMQNASRTDAMAQYNQTNAIDLSKFNAQLATATKQFNAQNALAIEQANVQYRRQLNTADTAAVNQANQINAQNSFNLSNQALSFLWQEMRDDAQWAIQAGEAAANRDWQESITQMEADAQKEAALYEALGAMGADLFAAWVATGALDETMGEGFGTEFAKQSAATSLTGGL